MKQRGGVVAGLEDVVTIADINADDDALDAPAAAVLEEFVKPLTVVSNDIVDAYCTILSRVANDADLIWSSTFYSLIIGPPKRRKDLAKRTKIGAKERILIAMVLDGHFAVLEVNVLRQEITIYDSIEGLATEKRWKIQAVRAFLNECTGKKFSAKLILAQCRQQGNSVDCAVYTCLNLRSLVERVDVNFPRMPGSHMKKATKEKKATKGKKVTKEKNQENLVRMVQMVVVETASKMRKN